MMTRAELAFGALDKNSKGYITSKDLKKFTKKLSEKGAEGTHDEGKSNAINICSGLLFVIKGLHFSPMGLSYLTLDLIVYSFAALF